MARCKWALIREGIGTRCFKEASHVEDPNRATHVGRGLEPDLLSFPLRNPGEMRWLAGDPYEVETDREDEYAWEMKGDMPWDWEVEGHG